MSVESNVQKGIPIEIIVKVKPEPYQRQDLRIYENKISLLDQYDRAVDEFITNGSIFEQTDAFRANFDMVFKKYLNAIIQGINLTVFTFGAKSTGKTFCLEGNANESGLYSLLIENIFLTLDTKREAILDEIQSLNIPEIESTSFTYQIRIKYIELKDETPIDLLQKYNYYKQPTQLIYSETEGYSITGAAWVNVPNSMAFPDLFAEAVKFRSNYDYNKVNKSSTMMTMEITQILENRSTRDVKHITSRINLFDLASADILAEHFRNLSSSLEYKSIYAFQNMIGELAKSHNHALPTIYENSIMTKLMKESIGSNGLCLGIFNVQNNNYAISNITFKMMKLCSHIQNYPIVNDSNCQGLLKKFRVDISYFSKLRDGMRLGDIKPPIIPNTKLETNIIPFDNNLNNNNLNDNNKNQLLEKEITRLQSDLQSSEDEKKKLLQSLAMSRNKQDLFRDYNMMDPDRYDVVDKLKHLDEDVDEVNEIMNTVNQLHDKVKSLNEERRQMEEEISALRTNNQSLALEVDKVSIEANNYRTNADNEMYNLKELLNSTKNELDYMRNEADKYRKIQSDLMLEIDEREVQFKKQLEDKEREIEMKMLELSQNEKRRLESELRELTRKLEYFGEENNDYIKITEELKRENNRTTLQIQEIRMTLREYLGKNIDENKNENKINLDGLQINPNSKTKLIKSFNDRENELIEQVSIEKAKSENLKEKLKKIRTFARKVRNVALDYFPVNEAIPELLTKDLEIFIEEPENESVIQFLEFEIRTLRERNKKIEFEFNKIKEDMKMNMGKPYDDYNKMQMNQKIIPQKNYSNNIPILDMQTNQNFNESEIQKRLLEEINKLKNTRPYSSSREIDKLKNDKEILHQENKKLKTIINESLLSRDDTGPSNENSSAFKQKIVFLEKTIQQLEKERSELSVRSVMAEEQLKNFQELINTTTQQYQKKILELNKRIEAGNLRNNRKGYSNFDD